MLEWFLCIHCERVFSANVPDNAEKDEYTGGFYLDDMPKRCAFKGCDGHVGDIWEWSHVRAYYPDKYPEVPIYGEKYPLYPDESDFERIKNLHKNSA